MSEVEQARAHLRQAQSILASIRRGDLISFGDGEVILAAAPYEAIRERENIVLAALSWVWDAQQRQIMREGEEALAEIVRLRRAGHDFLIPKEVREFIFSPFKFTDARPPYTAHVAG